MKQATKALGNKRLLRLAAVIATSDHYNQMVIIDDCGTPACALGHASYLWPKHFLIEADEDRYICEYKHSFLSARMLVMEGAEYFFSLSPNEVQRLFGAFGCNSARYDGKKAANYIRDFVRAAAGR